MLPSFSLVLLTFLAKVQQGQNQFNFGGGGGAGISPGFGGGGGGAGIPPGFGGGGIGSGGVGAGGIRDQFDDFVLSTLPKCKEASDCKNNDDGCAIGTAKNGQYVNICFPCENAKKAKDEGLTVKGCGLSALTIVGIVAGAILGLVLIGAGITLAVCFLKPNCPLYKWNQKRVNGGGQGDVNNAPAPADQQPYAYNSGKTDEEREPPRGEVADAGESVS